MENEDNGGQSRNPDDVAEVLIGPEAAFSAFPNRVVLAEVPYYLSRSPTGYVLFSTVCPHMGGEVVAGKERFECHLHGWKFALDCGAYLSAPNYKLSMISVRVREGNFYARLPRRLCQPL